MTGGTLAWGIAFAALCVVTGVMIGWPLGYRRGLKHGIEEAEWQRTDARWKGLEKEAARPVPVSPAGLPGIATLGIPPAPPQAPHAGPGKHRNPPGPRHAALPAAGYLPAPGPWDGTLTMPAPAQAPPWDIRPPEPPAQVLEPTAVLSPTTDTGWTREMAAQLADMDRFMAKLIGDTDSTLKEITR